MVQRRGQPRLLEESLAEARVFGELRSYQLQRHRPLEREVSGAVHDAHAAAPDERLDPVAREPRAWSEARAHGVLPVSDHPNRVRVSGGASPPGRGPLLTISVGAGGASTREVRSRPSPS